ncbi:hypothetical protein AGMMS50230_22370 [Spirochaetia bacterium]|nr:hypothetical protein AGMMS50230_22370 [Spirochaetia bacterium]
MRNCCFFILLFVLFSNIGQNIFADEIEEININPRYINGKLTVVIYYIPFSILTRSALGINAVKSIYHIKIEARDSDVYKFISGINNTKYNVFDTNTGDLRCVVEFYYDNNLIFSYALAGGYMIINGKRILDTEIFYNFIIHYLPRKYEHNILRFIKK